MIAREWLAREIKILNEELAKARRRREEADLKRIHAIDESFSAAESEEAIGDCLQRLRAELESQKGRE
jgi:hypothetical protein